MARLWGRMRLPDGLRRRRRRTDTAEGWRWLHVVGAGLEARDSNDGRTVQRFQVAAGGERGDRGMGWIIIPISVNETPIWYCKLDWI
ncbi:cupin domain-containing protein [Sesbania bispinosa]|nr:cupin domain-containing protein [Sesbania bispinosa]